MGQNNLLNYQRQFDDEDWLGDKLILLRGSDLLFKQIESLWEAWAVW